MVYNKNKYARNINNPKSLRNKKESGFSLDRSIIVLLNITNPCENMNNLRSGKTWLPRYLKRG
jgi:hypothetical protein